MLPRFKAPTPPAGVRMREPLEPARDNSEDVPLLNAAAALPSIPLEELRAILF